jgi:DNA-binding SARP family transcriptional activator
MTTLHIFLFGRFDVRCGNERVGSLSAHKAQEMLGYLLLHRDRPHRREALTHLMWPASTAPQAMKSFRNTLWQIRAALDADNPATEGDPSSDRSRPRSGQGLLLVDLEWVGIRPEARFWLDVEEFERVFESVHSVPGRKLQDHAAETVGKALDLYRGDLLEGCYQEWCILERERLQQMYLTLIEKLMAYCEVHAKYQAGLEYGIRALRCEVAHERIHRRLMRLHYLAGDRIASFRQYERCVAVLRHELDVDPSPRTRVLYEQIRSGRLLGPGEARPGGSSAAADQARSTPSQTPHCLLSLQLRLVEMQRQLAEAIDTIELAIKGEGLEPHS